MEGTSRRANAGLFLTPSRRDLEVRGNINGMLVSPKKYYRSNEIMLILVPDCIGEGVEESMRSSRADRPVTSRSRNTSHDAFSKDGGTHRRGLFEDGVPKVSRETNPLLTLVTNKAPVLPKKFKSVGYYNNFCRPRNSENPSQIQSFKAIKARAKTVRKICDDLFVKSTAKSLYKIVVQIKGIWDLNEFLEKINRLVPTIDAIREQFKNKFRYLCSMEGFYARSMVDILYRKTLICSFRKLSKIELISINRISYRIGFIFLSHDNRSDDGGYGFSIDRLKNNNLKNQLSTKISPPTTTSQEFTQENVPSKGVSLNRPRQPIKSHSFPPLKSNSAFDDIVNDTFGCYLNEPWTNCFGVDDYVGCGNFSTVHKIHCLDDKDKIFALKYIENKTIFSNFETIKGELNIIKILKSMKDSTAYHIVQTFDIFWDCSKGLGLVLEYADLGDLYNYVISTLVENESRTSPNSNAVISCLSENLSANITYQILLATNYLHSHNIIHRDLKLENILLFSNNNIHSNSQSNQLPIAKISDFGLSLQIHPLKNVSNQNCWASGVCGTPYYIAPEMLLGKSYGFPVDLWAVGIMLFTMLTGYPPFYSLNDDQDEIFQRILDGNLNTSRECLCQMSTHASVFIGCLLCHNPDMRITACEALQNQWIQNNI